MKTFSKQPGNEEKIFVSCPICGTLQDKILRDCGDYSFSKCDICGLVFQNPRPSVMDLIGRYDKEYFEYELREEKQFLDLMLKSLRDVNFFVSSANLKNEGFLDIGCATGILLEYLQKNNYRVSGLEICPESANYGINKRKIDIRINALEKEAFPDESFYFVHSSHVIEHIADPLSFLREIRRILKPGGALYLTTPNIDGFQAKIYKEKWRSFIPDHVVLFGKKYLGSLLRNEGFKIENIKTWGGMACGAGHPILKKILDPAAKKLGIGDVMIFAARKLLK